MIFSSDFFKNEINLIDHLEKAINMYNEQVPAKFEASFSRSKMEHLNSQIVPVSDEVAKKGYFESEYILNLLNILTSNYLQDESNFLTLEETVFPLYRGELQPEKVLETLEMY